MQHFVEGHTASFENQWHFSHAVRSRGLLFLSGVTGTGVDGTVSADPTAQFEQLFTHLHDYLAVAGCDFASLVEITTYHVDLPSHLESFVAIKDRHVTKPYPAWSAIGVSSLITPGALIELRAIAEAPEDDVEAHDLSVQATESHKR